MAQRKPEPDADALIDGCAHVETPAELRARLLRGKPLRVKFGVDPTGSDLHLGHAVVLHKMQQFVEAGHDVTLLIGDFTALIGDPSGRNDSRPHLDRDAIAHNMRTYTEQAGKILDLERVHVRYNSEWLAKLNLADLIRLLSQTTVAQMLSREDFRNRYLSETPIALHEFLYPVAQAYDSVALACDVELGGDDQLFNFLLARTYQTAAGQLPQICMTLPILEGTDGKVRMGKSRGNYIGLLEPAREQFGKTMSIPDALIVRWARLADFRSDAEAKALEQGIRDGILSPLKEKKKLAYEIVSRYHGPDAAQGEATYWDEKYDKNVVPRDISIRHVTSASATASVARANGSLSQASAAEKASARKLVDIIVDEGFADSKRAARNLISQRAVELDDVVVDDLNFTWPTGKTSGVLKVGKRHLVRIEIIDTLGPTSDQVETTVVRERE